MTKKADFYTHSNSVGYPDGALFYTSTLTRVPMGCFCLTYKTKLTGVLNGLLGTLRFTDSKAVIKLKMAVGTSTP